MSRVGVHPVSNEIGSMIPTLDKIHVDVLIPVVGEIYALAIFVGHKTSFPGFLPSFRVRR